MPRAKMVTREQLTELAKEVVRSSGKTQSEIADELGVQQSSVSIAINRPGASLDQLRTAIIEKYGGASVTGPVPYWTVVEADSDE